MKRRKQNIGNTLGNTLVELTLALAIGAIISVPLTAIIAAELRIPLRVFNDVNAASRLQSSTVILVEDATAAQSFVPGTEPDYGTFNRVEFAGSSLLAIAVRYYWKDGSMFREVSREGTAGQSFLVIDGITEYSDIVFKHTAPIWTYDPVTKVWSYAEGGISVNLDPTSETGSEFLELMRRGTVVADFRPQLERPEVFPQPTD